MRSSFASPASSTRHQAVRTRDAPASVVPFRAGKGERGHSPFCFSCVRRGGSSEKWQQQSKCCRVIRKASRLTHRGGAWANEHTSEKRSHPQPPLPPPSGIQVRPGFSFATFPEAHICICTKLFPYFHECYFHHITLWTSKVKSQFFFSRGTFPRCS